MKRIIAFVLAAAMLITLSACQKKDSADKGDGKSQELTELQKREQELAAIFDEENIVFTFGALSDIHLDGGYMAESSYNKSTTAFKTLQKLTTTGKLDAVLIAGDLVNCTNSMANVFAGSEKYPGTKEENYLKQAKAERDNFKKAVADALPDEIPLFYCLGNHDSVNGNHTAEFISEFSADGTYDRYFAYDVDMSGTAEGRRHCVIGGQHFFGIDLSSHPYPQAAYDWLRVEFDKILKEDKNANIFLAAHYGPEFAETFNAEGEDSLKEFLKAYPQVITFYGHNHDYIQKETAIMQDESGYITLNCGSANYFREKWASPDLDCVNVNKNYVEQFYGGYLVEIDREGDIRVRRINFKTGTICADDWIIPVSKDGKRELNYTLARAEKAQKPYFKEGAHLLLKQSTYTLQVGFDAAVCEDYVYYYKVEVFAEGSQQPYKVFAVSSRLFGDRSKEEAMKRFDVYVEPLEKGEYIVEVIPYDTFLNAGQSITAKLMVE